MEQFTSDNLYVLCYAIPILLVLSPDLLPALLSPLVFALPALLLFSFCVTTVVLQFPHLLVY